MSDALDNIIMRYKDTMSSESELFEDNLAVQSILPELMLLQNRKEKFYGQSWRKYGDIGAFMNIARKWDRIDTIMRDAMKTGDESLFNGSSDLANETILDTVIDLALYGLMWASYIATRYPELWKKFLKMNDLEVLDKKEE